MSKTDYQIYVEEAKRREKLTLSRIYAELDRAETIHPDWPEDLVYQASIMVEEATEALREANHIEIDGKPRNLEAFKTEVIQTAAMCLRILKNLE